MRTKGSLWFWRGVWGIGLLIGLGVFAFYGQLPADGATGDLESFTPQGFRVQWLLEEREGGLQVGDVIVRAGGHTVEEWLAGAPRDPEWRTGETVAYEILRDGRPLTLEVQLAPVPLRVIIARWALQLIGSAAFFSIGALVFWKRPRDTAARLLMLFCISVALQYWGDAYNFQFSTLPWRWPLWLHVAYEHGTFSLSVATICYFSLIFPLSHPLAKRFPRLAPFVLYASHPLAILAAMALSPARSDAIRVGGNASWVVATIQMGLAVYVGIRSARAARDPVTRAQIRWIVWIAAVGVAVLVPAYVLPLVLGGRPLLSHPVLMILIALLPISLAVAILRYRLFDIEIIVNRSLVYGTLTALLGGFYLLLVRLLTLAIQEILHREDDTLVVFIATLSVALVFEPLRRRVQALIDRVFYRTKLDYQRLLPELVAELATSIIPSQLAALLTKELPQRLQVGSATLAVLDLIGEQFVLVSGSGNPRALPADHPLAEYMYRLGRPLLRLQPPLDLPAEAQAFLDRHNIELSIPLIVGAALVGLYNLGPRLSGDAYSQYEVRALSLLGQQIAIAVQNSRLIQAAERQAGELAVLHRAAVAFSSSLEVEEVLYTLAEQLGHALHVSNAYICDLDEETAHSTVLAAWISPDITGYGLDLGTAYDMRRYPTVLKTLLERHPLVVQATDPDLDPADREGAEWYGWKSYLIVPLVVRGRVIGYAELWETRWERRFTKADVRLCQTLAADAAIAIEHARLFEEERLHARQLEIALARQQELDGLKDEFIQNVSHELRTPLALIRGYAELMDTGEFGELQPAQQKPISIIARRARMLGELVEDITLVLGIKAQPPAQESVALDELARATVEDFRVAADRAGLTLRSEIAPDLPPVRGASIYLRRVLDNLLGNAIKFTPAGGAVTIRVRQQDDQGIVEVTDTGIGISPEEQERIFERFYQVDGSSRRRYGGVGLGLALVKEIVEAVGGTIGVESEVGEGSTFTVALPISVE